MYEEQDLDWAVNKVSKDLIYLIRMGAIKLQEVPEILRTRDVCIEACKIDKTQSAYIPDDILSQMPDDIQTEAEKQKEFAEQKTAEEKIKCDHFEDQANERYYREVTGDYDHDYDVDAADKKKERGGDAFIDI